MSSSGTGFGRFAWGAVFYNLLVIMYGAVVRITHSGDGCGEDWPRCGGELIPQDPSTSTLIEYTHRLTSGVTLLLSVALVVWAFRAFSVGHRVRRAAFLTLFFVCLEALLGAALVVFGLVADNDSVLRAVVVVLHLVNTYGLLGFGALTAWWAVERKPSAEAGGRRGHVVLGGLALVLVGATGAITALGDTLFPVSPATSSDLMTHIVATASASEHFLVRLRIIHPILASLVAAGILVFALQLYVGAKEELLKRVSGGVALLVCVQVGIGFLNIWLMVPLWLQLTHLLVADLLWIALVVLWAQIPRVSIAETQAYSGG